MTATLPANWRENPRVAAETRAILREAVEARTPARVWERPTDLATAIDPNFVVTPAIRLIEQAVMDCYNTPNGRLIISIGPQEGKSQVVTRFSSLWRLNRAPETRIGIASYAAELATSFGRDIRNWIQTYDGTGDNLDLRLRISADSAAAGRWQLRKHRGGVYSVGVGGTLTGRALDALIIDDPFKDAEQADSETYRAKVWDWWRAVAATRLAPGAPVIVIMTRWHEDDLAGRLLAADDGHLWRVVNIPALADHDPEKGQTDPLGRAPGEWLESARGRTVEEWEAIKVRSGSRVFTALYQGVPSPDAGNVWKRQYWRRYDTLLWSIDSNGNYRVACDEMIMSWDMAFKDTKSSDYVVGQVWARRGGEAYLLDQVRKRLSFTDTVKAFEALVRKWPQAHAKLVEDKANGPAVIDSLRAKIPGIVAVEPDGSKYARAQAVSPFIEAGSAILPSTEVALFDAEEFVDEAAGFPNGTHDDQVDAASQALARLFIDGHGATAWLAYMDRRIAQTKPADEAAEVEAPAAVVAVPDDRQTARLAQRRDD